MMRRMVLKSWQSVYCAVQMYSLFQCSFDVGPYENQEYLLIWIPLLVERMQFRYVQPMHKNVRRGIVNMVYPTNSVLVIQTKNGKHAVRFRFDVGHLETKKNKILVEVLERIRFVCVHSCSSCVFTFLHLYVFRCDDNVFHVVHVFVFLSCGSCFSCSDYMPTMCFFLTAMTLRLFN